MQQRYLPVFSPRVAIIFAQRTNPPLSLLLHCCPLATACPSSLVCSGGSLTPARLAGLSHSQPSTTSSNAIPQWSKDDSLELPPDSPDTFYCLQREGRGYLPAIDNRPSARSLTLTAASPLNKSSISVPLGPIRISVLITFNCWLLRKGQEAHASSEIS